LQHVEMTVISSTRLAGDYRWMLRAIAGWSLLSSQGTRKHVVHRDTSRDRDVPDGEPQHQARPATACGAAVLCPPKAAGVPAILCWRFGQNDYVTIHFTQTVRSRLLSCAAGTCFCCESLYLLFLLCRQATFWQ
jgi:hypothetical protein